MRPWGLVLIILAVLAAYFYPLFVMAQDAHEAHRGQHPMAGEPDPYAKATTFPGSYGSRYNCCHGTDCTPWNGPPPVKHVRNGISGWLVGRWFFSDEQRIDPMTLPPDLRGDAHICIGVYGSGDSRAETPRCFYYPQNG
jgi:hypothetical protein